MCRMSREATGRDAGRAGQGPGTEGMPLAARMTGRAPRSRHSTGERSTVAGPPRDGLRRLSLVS